jgi:carboxymethylenebutenolidase
MNQARRSLLIAVILSLLGVGLGLACRASTSVASPDDRAKRPTGTEIVAFSSGPRVLRGLLLRPPGPGPFPAVLYNHGSAPGMANDLAFASIAPSFVARGWVFFMPYRRGQGLSQSAGPYIGDQIEAVRTNDGDEAAAVEQMRLLESDHLDDQLAARAWLQGAAFVQASRIVTAGNSYGGIEAVLGAERGGYCAAVDASGGAESWARSAPLRDRMTSAAKHAKAPIFFFQAANDFDLSPTQLLSGAMRSAGKPAWTKIYPEFGSTAREGHSFAYRGVAIWRDDVFRFLDQACSAGPSGAHQE